jgi:alpha-tubulin suppressor-like RCC1 family protein
LSGIKFIEISAGSAHTLGLTSEGTVYAWGFNTDGQLGNNSNVLSQTPVQVHGVGNTGFLTGVTSIAAGTSHSLALTPTGVYAWGGGGWGKLGDGSYIDRRTPVQVHGVDNIGFLTGVTSIAAGTNHSLALTPTGVYTWGTNTAGQLGVGNSDFTVTPVQVHGVDNIGFLTGVTSIAAGTNHSLAVTPTGVYAWGANTAGQLGDGSYDDRWTPVQVRGVRFAPFLTGDTPFLTSVTSIAAGETHSLALTSTGVYAWGRNSYGQLGDNSIEYGREYPVQVVGVAGEGTTLNGVTSIAAGKNHSLALTPTGVYAWGRNDYGQIDNNNTDTLRESPVQVVGVGNTEFLSGVTSIAAGGTHSVALTPTGVTAWGDNRNGQLGDGSSTTRWTPVLSANFQPLTATFAGTAGTELSNTGNIWSVTTPTGAAGSAEILATANIFGGTVAASPSTASWSAGTFTYVAAAPLPDPIVTFPAVNFAAGGATTVTATGFPANTLIRVELRSTPVTLGTFTTNSLGGFTTTVTIPLSTPAGNHHVVFVNTVTSQDLSSTAITVASVGGDPQTSPGVSALATTGISATEPLLQGMILLFLGLGVMVLARRRLRSNK